MAYLLSHRFSKIKVFKKNYTLYLTKSRNITKLYYFVIFDEITLCSCKDKITTLNKKALLNLEITNKFILTCLERTKKDMERA